MKDVDRQHIKFQKLTNHKLNKGFMEDHKKKDLFLKEEIDKIAGIVKENKYKEPFPMD